MAATPFQKEAWTEYAIGMLILLCRIGVRCRLIGWKWHGDDYFAVAAVFFWTAELVMLELIGQYGSTTGMSDEIALTLNEEQKRRIVIGTKCLLAGWCLYVTLIWCLKACMLFLFRRLTLNLEQQKAVKFAAMVCGVAYVVTIIVILSHCHPIQRLWQVYPYPGDDCALNISNYLTLVVTNVVTDLLVLWIPLPLLWRVKLPLHRKILYGLWLCSGIFIVVCTLLRCILCLKSADSINLGTIWSIRETFVGIIAVNMPILQPLISRGMSLAGSVTGLSSKYGKYGKTGNASTVGTSPYSRIERRAKQERIRDAMGLETLQDNSEERIIRAIDPNAKNNGVSVSTSTADVDGDNSDIQVTTSYNVSRSAA